MDDIRQGNSRRERITRIVLIALTILTGSFAVDWAVKWLRGDPDEFRNEIVGGLMLTTAMTLLTSAQLMRTGRVRWALLGTSGILLAINLTQMLIGARNSLVTVLALLLIVASLVRFARVLWPKRGVSFAEWKTMPITLEGRRRMCTAVAAANLGVALLCLSIFGVPRGPWLATAVTLFTTLVFLGTAVAFLVLRARLRE
jgi:hypothetical protein